MQFVQSAAALVAALLIATPALAEEKWYKPHGVNDGLKKVKHVVLFMQENRAFDHYFGTMAGVRGFQDPNVQVSNNTGTVSYTHLTLPTIYSV